MYKDFATAAIEAHEAHQACVQGLLTEGEAYGALNTLQARKLWHRFFGFPQSATASGESVWNPEK